MQTSSDMRRHHPAGRQVVTSARCACPCRSRFEASKRASAYSAIHRVAMPHGLRATSWTWCRAMKETAVLRGCYRRCARSIWAAAIAGSHVWLRIIAVRDARAQDRHRFVRRWRTGRCLLPCRVDVALTSSPSSALLAACVTGTYAALAVGTTWLSARGIVSFASATLRRRRRSAPPPSQPGRATSTYLDDIRRPF